MCNDGFFGDGISCFEGTCTDDLCPDNEQCHSASTFDCQCRKGFDRDKNGSCVDEDECDNNGANCNKNAECLNTEGSYKCSCKQKYFGDGESCLFGKCLDTNCPQNMTCVSQTTSDCKCKNGLTMDTEAENCVDIDECEVECGTNADCINTFGSYKCICKNGFYEDVIACESPPVLLLSPNKPAVLINPAGEERELPCFKKKHYHSVCSLSWKNSMYFFGELIQTFDEYPVGISRLEGFSIKNVGELDFNHYSGACGNMNDEFIFLCFDLNEITGRCRRATDPLGPFAEVARPYMEHFFTRISPSRSKFIN